MDDQEAMDAVDYLYGGQGDGEQEYKIRLVTVRKTHPCQAPYGCRGVVKGEKAVLETCVLEDEGWKSAYTCLRCAGKAFEEIRRLRV